MNPERNGFRGPGFQSERKVALRMPYTDYIRSILWGFTRIRCGSYSRGFVRSLQPLYRTIIGAV